MGHVRSPGLWGTCDEADEDRVENKQQALVGVATSNGHDGGTACGRRSLLVQVVCE